VGGVGGGHLDDRRSRPRSSSARGRVVAFIRPSVDDLRDPGPVRGVMRLTDEPTGIVVFSHDDRAVAQPLALPQVSGPHPTIVHHSSQFRQILASVDPFTAGGKIGHAFSRWADATPASGASRPHLSGGQRSSGGSACTGELQLEHDRDRPLVDELDHHAGAEDARLHRHAEIA
jgi:hypothetical protein